MQLDFEKWHGSKNDFILVYLDPRRTEVYQSLLDRAQTLCAKDGTGIGADGILLVSQSPSLSPQATDDPHMTIVNADGSIASHCGNGSRCAIASWLRENDADSVRISIVKDFTRPKQSLSKEILGRSLRLPDGTFGIEVQMGVPHRADLDSEMKGILNAAKFKTEDYIAVDLGNLHLCLFKPSWSETARKDLLNLLPVTTKQKFNIHFCEDHLQMKADPHKISGREVFSSCRMIPYERGVGYTPACGSGACAASYFFMERDDLSHNSWLRVEMPGGSVYCRMPDKDLDISLLGPAQKVFTGTIDF